MPLTKEVQIHYLLRRLGAPLVAYVGRPLASISTGTDSAVCPDAPDSGLTSARWYFEDKNNLSAGNPDYRSVTIDARRSTCLNVLGRGRKNGGEQPTPVCLLAEKGRG